MRDKIVLGLTSLIVSEEMENEVNKFNIGRIGRSDFL
jgi:hypothetical protein